MCNAIRNAGGLVALIVALALTVGTAHATTGYFSHGCGVDYKGMAGAGSALALNSFAGAHNPAALSFLGQRYDVDVALFSPRRSYTVTNNPSGMQGTFGLAPGTFDSENEGFFIPSLAGNWRLREGLTLGVAVYGNGGMNTQWPTNTFGGTSPVGVDLSQAFLAPSLSWRVNDMHGIGVTPIFAFQWFEATGLEAFGGFSGDAPNLTNNGYDQSYGGGVRVGYLGQFTSVFSLGASFQSRMWMTEFDEYAGLFAESGGFDIPPTWVVGLGVQPNNNLRLAFDVSQILYEEVAAVSNSMLPGLQTNMLGSESGAGFGWQNIYVFKGGAEYDLNRKWTVRGGYSYNDQPIPDTEVMFNILAPGVQQHHITGGTSFLLNDHNEIGLAVMYSPSSTVTGTNPLEVPDQQTIELEMSQWEVALGFTYR
ncbi:MAG: hypothetical protein HKN20_02775 [Gemmatimonadetes bacterium]|nr:hypothetical protein [Gemmatimonadota bacterium]